MRGEFAAHKRSACIRMPVPLVQGIPWPASGMDGRTLPVSDRSNSIASSRALSVFFIASISLLIRFMTTCCNWMRPALTWGRSAASSVKTDMSFCVALPRHGIHPADPCKTRLCLT